MGGRVMHRENAAGKFTSFAHYSPDGKPVASSFPGWLSADECQRLVNLYRERVA